VVVTGCAGFLGSHLCDWFINHDWEVVGIDNLFGGSLENIHDYVEFHNFDITNNNIQKMASYFANSVLLIHAAASPYEGVSNFAPSYICDNIYSGSVNVFTAAIIAKVPRIVFCSSMARYGVGDPPFNEHQIPEPVDPYGISKESAERVLKNLCDTHGVDWSIAVPHNIYGPKQKYNDPYRNVASIMANRMLQNKQPIIYGNGQQKRCFSYIDDCVESLVKMGTQDNCIRETVNIGPEEEEVTILELSETIADIIGFKLDPIFMPDRPREVKIAHCSSMKAKFLLDYKQTISLREGLVHLIDWIKEKGPKPFEYHLSLEILNKNTPRTWTDQLI
jgi:UDP-glucose 4-epimerase